MLRSIRTHAVVRSRTRLGSSGERGSHSGSSDQPGTRVQCRTTTSPTGPVTFRPRPLTSSPSRVTRGASRPGAHSSSARMLSASGRLLYQSSRRITGRAPSAARSWSRSPGPRSKSSCSWWAPLWVISMTPSGPQRPARRSSRHRA
ncbi:hypothetical protein IQ279_09860 [Streptomyces verrucosisporus]|nr:hypothetical protein [Streptomyces verrucosisporus]